MPALCVLHGVQDVNGQLGGSDFSMPRVCVFLEDGKKREIFHLSEEKSVVVLLGSDLVRALLICGANLVTAGLKAVVCALFGDTGASRRLTPSPTTLQSTIILWILFSSFEIFISLGLAALARQPSSSRCPGYNTWVHRTKSERTKVLNSTRVHNR